MAAPGVSAHRIAALRCTQKPVQAALAEGMNYGLSPPPIAGRVKQHGTKNEKSRKAPASTQTLPQTRSHKQREAWIENSTHLLLSATDMPHSSQIYHCSAHVLQYPKEIPGGIRYSASLLRPGCFFTVNYQVSMKSFSLLYAWMRNNAS